MKHKKSQFLEIFSKAKIRQQLYGIYILAVFFPIVVIGSFLLGNTSKLLLNYYQDLLESDNLRVKTILFEITTQTYNISENICFEDALQDVLTKAVSNENGATVKTYATIDNYITAHAELDDIIIYTDSPFAADYMHFEKAQEDIVKTDWYQKASEQSSVFWMPLERKDKYGNSYWNLCLIRKIPVIDSGYSAVLVMQVSDNYLQSRIRSNEHRIAIAADNRQIFYNSERNRYGEELPVYIDSEDEYYQYLGPVWEDAKKLLTDVSTLHLYQSESKLYVATMNETAYEDIRSILFTCLLIILVAILLPGILIHYFTGYFTGRVNVLRGEMNKASNEDYDILPGFRGDDELSEAFADLQIMVTRIKEKDARMYQARLNEQQLLNEQQVMEMKMLASQINPHFLYNTLESIRMQALTAGNREVANSIKLLGRSMRYVLENTGTTSITLKKELDYIETYLMIQKMRFGSRVNYQLVVEDDIVLDTYRILPLLLQPVIENAILHGMEQVVEDGQVEIRISVRDEACLQIAISDNGCGMDSGELEQLRRDMKEKKSTGKSSSIGLGNICERIRLCYGGAYGMDIVSAPGKGTTVILRLPIVRDN